MRIYNVFYNAPDGLRRYCVSPMDLATAKIYRDKFNAKYPGKPYPNGKGWYPFSEAWVALHSDVRGVKVCDATTVQPVSPSLPAA